MSGKRRSVLAAMKRLGRQRLSSTPAIAHEAGWKPDTIEGMLYRLRQDGYVAGGPGCATKTYAGFPNLWKLSP